MNDTPITLTLSAASGFGGVIDFFVTGGLFMIPLVAASVISVAVIYLRWRALRPEAVLPPALIEETERLAPGRHPLRLAELAFTTSSALSRVYRVALANLRWPKAENIEAVQTRARQEVLSLERGLVILEIIVGIGPLLGLLGAVSGLVAVFSNLDPAGMGANPSGVARGIAEALHTTIMGLAVAVPSLVAHSYFSKRVEVMAVQMESLVSELLMKCYGDHPSRPSEVAMDLSEWMRQERALEEQAARRGAPETSSGAGQRQTPRQATAPWQKGRGGAPAKPAGSALPAPAPRRAAASAAQRET